MATEPEIRLECLPGQHRPDLRAVLYAMNGRYFGFKRSDFHDGWWWTARVGTDLVGFAGAADHGLGRLFLGLCGVVPEHRNRGLHARFIHARETLARSQGFRELVTYTDRDNLTSANNFLRRRFLLRTAWCGRQPEGALYFGKPLP